MIRALSSASAPWTGLDGRRATATAGVLLLEALLLIVVVALFPKLIGSHAEAPSPWAVLLLTIAGFALSHRLALSAQPPARRWLLGALFTVAALQIVGRLDLSESWRIWDFGWIGDLADSGSPAWRRFGRIDHLLSALALVAVWFRGVRLGSVDLEERSLVPLLVAALVVFSIGFIAADDAGVVSTVRLSALLFVALGMAVLAFRNAGHLQSGGDGGFAVTGFAFLSTFAALAGLVVVFMLIVTAVVALIAGADIAEPVTDALGVALRAIFIGIAYAVWPLVWFLRQLVDLFGGDEVQELPPLLEGGGLLTDLVPEMEAEEGESSGLGAVLVRVFGAIGVLLVFAVLVVLLFRRFLRRADEEDELRESLWDETHLFDDILGGLRALRRRFTRRPRLPSNKDAAIAELYFDLLAHAERNGTVRHPARTPLQFAPVLQRAYLSDLPLEISRRFAEQRYAARDTDPADVRRLQTAWRQLKLQTDG